MKTKITDFIIQNKNIILIALVVAYILLLLLIAMQFTDRAAWSLFDFAIAGALLFGTGLVYELVARKAGILAYRVAVGIALAAALLLVWSNISVGIIGSEDNPANLMYIGVLAVLIISSLIAHFRPHGMARALFATALVQALVTIIALITVEYPAALTLILNGFFIALWVGAALLFRCADASLADRQKQSTPTSN